MAPRPAAAGGQRCRRVGSGRVEFCIGGTSSNRRTSAHLRRGLPGVTIGSYQEGQIRVGDEAYAREPDAVEYALVAKIVRPGQERSMFLVCGQTAIANQAAAAYLVANHRRLARTHGFSGRFCLVLRVLDPTVYGAAMVEIVRDAIVPAFALPKAEDTPPAPV